MFIFLLVLPFDTSSRISLCSPSSTTFDTKSISQEFPHISSLDSNSNAYDYRSSLDKMDPITNGICVCVIHPSISIYFSIVFQYCKHLECQWQTHPEIVKPTCATIDFRFNAFIHTLNERFLYSCILLFYFSLDWVIFFLAMVDLFLQKLQQKKECKCNWTKYPEEGKWCSKADEYSVNVRVWIWCGVSGKRSRKKI